MSGKMTKQFKTAIINKLKNIDIPDWVKYIAADADGRVWGFYNKPEAGKNTQSWFVRNGIANSKFLFTIDFDSTNWKKTLIKLKDIDLDTIESVKGSANNTPKVDMLIPPCYDQVKESIDGDDDEKKLPWGDPNKSERLIRFKLWNVGDKSVVWKILHMENMSKLHEQPKKLISKSLLDFRNIEGCFTFPSKEIRKQSIEASLKELKSIVHYKEIATKNHIGKEVNTFAGIAKVVSITIEGKYLVTYPKTGSQLVIVNEATVPDGLIGVFSEEPNQSDGSTLYEIYTIKK